MTDQTDPALPRVLFERTPTGEPQPRYRLVQVGGRPAAVAEIATDRDAMGEWRWRVLDVPPLFRSAIAAEILMLEEALEQSRAGEAYARDRAGETRRECEAAQTSVLQQQDRAVQAEREACDLRREVAELHPKVAALELDLGNSRAANERQAEGLRVAQQALEAAQARGLENEAKRALERDEAPAELDAIALALGVPKGTAALAERVAALQGAVAAAGMSRRSGVA